MLTSVKNFFGYGSPRGPDEDPFRPIERDAYRILATAQLRQHDFSLPEKETSAKRERTKTAEQLSIVNGSTKERTSLDSRRKDSVRGQGSISGGSTDDHRRWEQRHDPERQQMGEIKRGRAFEPGTSDPRETSSVKEPASIESRRKELGRGRAYSASTQDIPSFKAHVNVQPDERTKETGAIHNEKREQSRGRARSVVRRDARSLEGDRVVDDLSVERVRKRRDVSGVRDPVLQGLLERNNKLERLLEQLHAQLSCSEQKKIELHKLNNVLRDEKAQLLERESAAAKREREAQQKAADFQEKYRRLEEEVQLLRGRLRSSEDKNSQTKTLLQARTADLRGAEAFLTTANPYSGSDVISMVQILNAEIFQAAAFMAELLEDPTMVAPEDDRKKMLQKYSHLLEEAPQGVGSRLFVYCAERGTRVRSEPLPLQLALQSLLCQWCTAKIERFANDDLDSHLLRLYQEIQKNEPQTVTGRWRSITYGNIKKLYSLTYSDQVLEMAISLLCLCGWSVNSPRSQKAILSMQQMIKAMEKLWIQVKNATKECITSADISISTINFDQPYDETKMEDSYGEAPGKSNAQPQAGTRVLCTVAIGLKRTVMKTVEGMANERQEDIMVKPKVALESVLSDISEPAPDKLGPPNRMDGR